MIAQRSQGSRRAGALALAAAVLRAGVAGATDPPPSAPSTAEEQAEDVLETRVHGRIHRGAPEDDPSAFTTVIAIQDAGPGARLSDLLAEVPGLRVSDTGLAGRQTASLRGAAGHQLTVYLDGIRLTPPGGGAVDLALLAPAHLEAVEVRRSAGAARFGEGALGGALLLRTPRLRMRAHSRAAVGMGSFGAVALQGSRGATWRSVRYLASASYQQGKGDYPYVDDNGVSRWRANNDWRAGEALLKVDRLWPSWRLGLLNSFGMAERGAPGMSQRPSLRARQQDLRNLTGVTLSRFGLLLPEDELQLALHHSYGYFRFDEPDPPPVRSVSDRSTLGGGAQLKLPLGAVGRLGAGLEVRGDMAEVTTAAPAGSAEDAPEINPRRVSAGLWATSQTRLLAGLLSVAPAVRLTLASGFAPTVGPQAGLVIAPLFFLRRSRLAALQITANLGRSFRLPSFEEMYVRVEGFSGNPQLRPEDALVTDVGVRWRGRRAAFEVAYFARAMKNTILFAPVSPVMVRPDNYSRVLAQGVESALEVEPGACLQLRAAHTYTRARFGEPAARLPGIPGHRAVGRLAWAGSRCPARLRRSAVGRGGRGLEIWAAASLESAMVLGRFESLPEEGRVMLSMGGSLRWRSLRLQAEAHNLLDKRDAVDAVGFPLPPARIFVSLAAAH